MTNFIDRGPSLSDIRRADCEAGLRRGRRRYARDKARISPIKSDRAALALAERGYGAFEIVKRTGIELAVARQLVTGD